MSYIHIKNEKEIEIMREAGQILGSILSELKNMATEGTDVWKLEERFIKLCEFNSVRPACKGYAPSGFPPFPTGLCISIDEESVHCYPEEGRKLKEGDLLTIDTVIEHKGLFVDSAITFGIGNITKDKENIAATTKKALLESIKIIKPGIKSGLISSTMQKIVEDAGYSVLREYAGHGIGKSMHEAPEIPCYGNPEEGVELLEGMTLAVEPLVCENSEVLEHKNHWQTRTVDGGLFAQEEHTVLVTKDGYEVLTKRE